MSKLQSITETLITGDGDMLKTLVESAVNAGTPAGEIVQNSLIVGMDIVGDKMESGDMLTPELLMASKAMSTSVECLKPLLAEGESASAGKVLI